LPVWQKDTEFHLRPHKLQSGGRLPGAAPPPTRHCRPGARHAALCAKTATGFFDWERPWCRSAL